MAENLTENLVKAVAVDYVEQFGRQMRSLTELLGAYDPIALPIGSVLKTYTSKVTLAGGVVPKGDLIPLSEVEMEDGPTYELVYDKRRKAVAAEDIQKYGFERAIAMTDEALIKELHKGIRTKLVANLSGATGTATGAGLQASLANAWGKVQTAFEDDAVNLVAFVNPEDAADYLGRAEISTQTMFGMKYVENFLGVDLVFINSQITKGTAFVTAANNLKVAYANVRGEMSKAFPFITDSTGIIGILHDVNASHLTAETVTLSATVMFAERLDGVVKATITPIV